MTLENTASGVEWLNAGSELIEREPKQARLWIRQGLLTHPVDPLGWFNLGLCLHQLGYIEQAIRAYRRSLERPSGHEPAIENNLGQDLLLAGHFKEGWARRERRRSMGCFEPFEQALGPGWSGPGDPRGNGDGLLLISEQGLGDTLMFCRFALMLQVQGLKVRLLCQPALVGLLLNSTELRLVEPYRSPRPGDQGWRWAPLLSLPQRMGILEPPWCHASGYLEVSGELTHRQALWRRRLQKRPGHRLIGLHWQGNPKHEDSLYTRGRSMKLECWEGMRATVPEDVDFVSLQKGAGSEQWNRHSPLPFVAGQEEFQASMDLIDSAAVISLCDLVLSCDSGVVHLAGALGIPTWVALRWIPEWRWGLQGVRTPWYRSLRLFRQKQNRDWAGVVREISERLLHQATIN